ncbi:MAG: cation:proton antiporter [Reyranellaceae bacterium]
MHHEATLISTVAMGLLLAFLLGFLASRLKLPPLVGYLLAGVVLGPYTPGFTADQDMAGQLAEIGVILLMFGVGLHFSAADLIAVRWIAVPGAVGQIVIATIIGAAMAMSWGWSLGAGLVLGLSLSVASTVVMLRALDARNAVESVNGRIAVGWLIVEDLAMVLALVLLPALAEVLGGTVPGDGHAPAAATGWDLLWSLLLTIGKVVLFVIIALVAGPRIVPWILARVARAGSREMFTLSVLAVALGIAYGSAELFDVSFALGAFFAGLILSESPLSQKAAAESLPLQNAFAVLFFVSVGMLFDPSIVVREPLEVVAVLLLIMIGKSLVALGIVMAFGYPVSSGLMVSASLAQVGEFSFILAGLGIAYGLLPTEGRDLILAGALLSITLNPLAFAGAEKIRQRIMRQPNLKKALETSRRGRLRALKRELEEARAGSEHHGAHVALDPQDFASRFPMFAGLDGDRRQELIGLLRPRSAEPGERVIREGDRANAMFFISSGKVEVHVGNKRLKLEPGDFFGEMALLSGGRRTADVVAVDYCQFLTLDVEDFRAFLEKHPDLRSQFDTVAAQRGAMNLRIAEHPDDDEE